MHLLVIGANGLLGSNVVHHGVDRGVAVSGTYRSSDPGFDVPCSRLDVTDADAVTETIESQDPDWVVNCAAMTDVDACEDAPERAHAVNARAPGEIAAHCVETDRDYLHVSTDYVFDGESTAPYTETAPVNPLQEYGRSKLAGERAVREAMADAVVVRLSFVYGVHRGSGVLTGFPAWVRDRLAAGEETPLFIDQHVTPSRAGQTAETLLELVETAAQGTFNVASRSCVTPYEFGEAIREEMAADESLLVAGNRSDVDRAAKRPAHTCLDVTKLEERLGREQPTLAADLTAIADRFERSADGR